MSLLLIGRRKVHMEYPYFVMRKFRRHESVLQGIGSFFVPRNTYQD